MRSESEPENAATSPSPDPSPWRRWPNFHVWRGRLPHWRADGVLYYVEFRHRRALDEVERGILMDSLRKSDGRRCEFEAILVLPEITRILLEMRTDPATDAPYELSDVIERAKNRASKTIIKRSEERFGPFYTESYDRIPRDEAEREALFLELLEAPVQAELADGPDGYPGLWVPDAP